MYIVCKAPSWRFEPQLLSLTLHKHLYMTIAPWVCSDWIDFWSIILSTISISSYISFKIQSFLLIKYPTLSCFPWSNSVKVLNYLILCANKRQGHTSKPARVGVSSKQVGTTYASTSKKKSLNYLSPYFVVACRKSLIENPYLVFFPLADLVYQNKVLNLHPRFYEC